MPKHGSDYRWKLGGLGRTTIVVLENPDSEERRQRRIEEGAEVLPFGFARAVPREEREPRAAEPLRWEGDDG